ncbi:MAG: hypothetical protein ACRD59_06355 [Candidatus Acidiferrales bacterium]
MSPAPETADLAALIRRLGEPDSAIREHASAELFRRGRELGGVAAAKWFADPEFAQHFALDATHLPETTVGIAVTPESFDRIRDANGSPRLADVPPDQDAREFELHFARGVQVDILTTREPGGSGAIARYLQKFGEGIQQIEFLTRDVDTATGILRSRFAVQPIYPATRPGADGTRVNFFLAAAADGTKVLIELVEPAARKK